MNELPRADERYWLPAGKILTTAPIPRERALSRRDDLDFMTEAQPCGRCGRPTHYIDISFCCPLCPHPCYHAMWNDYWEALRR